MGTPFMSEIRIMAFNFAPKGWAMANGQFLPINQNQALFSLLGTMYGGNGQTTFALPDFRGRVPLHQGAGFTIGQQGGQEVHTVTQSEMPQHVHLVQATSALADTNAATGNLLAGVNNGYTGPAALVSLHPQSITNVGGSQPHTNMQPYAVFNFCIALQGAFPTQS